MKRLIRYFISGELFFALFLFAGVFKESLNLPIDISALFLVLTFFSIILKIGAKKTFNIEVLLPIISIIIVYVILLISYIITPSEIYSTEKILKFTIITVPTIVFSLLLFDNRQSLYRFFISLAIISVILSLLSLPSIFQRGSSLSFIGFNGGNYQGLARLNGVGLIILVFFFLTEAKTIKSKVISLISALLVVFVLFASGSRMPIVAFSIAGIYLLSKSIFLRRGVVYIRKGIKLVLLLLVLALAMLPVIIKKGFFETIIYRFAVLFTEDQGGTSSSGRIDRFSVAHEMISESPFIGKGLGSFPMYFNGNDLPDYPHNMIIEIIAEIGIIGLLAFSTFFLISYLRAKKFNHAKNRVTPTLGMVTIGLFVYYLANAMVSGDINSNRVLYVFMSIMCMFPVIFINDNKVIEKA